jgi:hypothetical protein
MVESLHNEPLGEFIEEEAQEPGHSEESIGGLQEFAKEEGQEEEHRAAGAEFEPSVEPSSKADLQLQPVIRRAAQIDPPTETAPAPSPKAPSPELPYYEGPERRERSRIAEALERSEGQPIIMFAPKQNKQYYARKAGENAYELFLAQTSLERMGDTMDEAGLLKFERNVGGLEVTAALNKQAAQIMELAINSAPSLKDWRNYWQSVGKRVAQAKKSLTPEQKERRKQRRKEREMERKGLPPGAVIPPKKLPKAAAGDIEGLARMKEKLRLYEQLVDEIEYVLEQETVRGDEVVLADELERTLDEYHQQTEEMDREHESEMLDGTNIETPPKDNITPQIAPLKSANKIVVSMSEL